MITALNSMKCCKCNEQTDVIYMIVRAGYCYNCKPQEEHSITIVINHKAIIEINGSLIYDYDETTWTDALGCIIILEES